MNISALKIETILAERHMTKSELSMRCGIAPQNISTVLRRGTCAPLTVGKIADGLGVNVQDILASTPLISSQSAQAIQSTAQASPG